MPLELLFSIFFKKPKAVWIKFEDRRPLLLKGNSSRSGESQKKDTVAGGGDGLNETSSRPRAHTKAVRLRGS